MASIKVVLFTSKTLSNGEHPIAIRIIKDTKPLYLFIQESCSAALWDSKKDRPKAKHPLSRELEAKIERKLMEAKQLAYQLESEKGDFSLEEFKHKYQRQNRKVTVLQFIGERVDELKSSNRLGNAQVYQSLGWVLSRFRNEKDFTFSELDISFLRRFEQDLRERNLAETTMSNYFRTLRAVVSRAVEDGLMKTTSDPFKIFKINKFNTKTRKRAIQKLEIKKIEELDVPSDDRLLLAQKVFMFSYYTYGININDIATLRWSNINGNTLVYKRTKTGQLNSHVLLDQAIAILDTFEKGPDYIFPILFEDRHQTADSIKNRIKKMTKQINQDLKTLGTLAGIPNPETLTTYVARHTTATVLRKQGLPTAQISQLLGHESEKTTRIYLDSFDREDLYTATKDLL